MDFFLHQVSEGSIDGPVAFDGGKVAKCFGDHMYRIVPTGSAVSHVVGRVVLNSYRDRRERRSYPASDFCFSLMRFHL